MNGGAYGAETKDILIEARGVDRQGNIRSFGNADMGFSYRHCGIADDVIFTSATSRAAPAIRRQSPPKWPRSRTSARPATAQPHRRLHLQEPAGSQCLEAGGRGRLPRLTGRPGAGLRAAQQFLISLDGASASDIERLGETVRARVKESPHRTGMGN